MPRIDPNGVTAGAVPQAKVWVPEETRGATPKPAQDKPSNPPQGGSGVTPPKDSK